jgi:hypothetical protein
MAKKSESKTKHIVMKPAVEPKYATKKQIKDAVASASAKVPKEKKAPTAGGQSQTSVNARSKKAAPAEVPVEETAPVKPKRTTKAKTAKIDFKGATPKELANAKGEPWVNVLSVELDPDNIGNGAFELDWNEKFITNLIRAGYKGKTDADMVDQWFSDICRNVLAENFEQWEANQPMDSRPRVVDRKDLGDGRTEVS